MMILKDIRACLKIAWPLVLAMAGNALMMFVDRLFLSRYSAVSIQAALPAGLVSFLLMALFQNLAAYSGTFVAQYAGSGARAACARAAAQGLWISLLCVPAMLLCWPLGNALFEWVGHAPEVVAQERAYYGALVIGGLSLPFAAALSGFFAGRGHTRLVMVANLVGNITNIVLDPLFIWGLGPIPSMGIVGAGVATAVGQFLILGILLFCAAREPHFATGRRRRVTLAWKRPLAQRITRYGLPAGGHVLLDVGTFTIFTFVTGWLGTLAFAASNIAFSINNLVFAPLMGFGIAANIMVGQRMGERDTAGAARAGWACVLLGWGYILLCILVIGGLTSPLLRLFYPADATFSFAEYAPLGRRLIIIFLVWSVFDTLSVVLGGALKGAGDTTFVVCWVGGVALFFWMPTLFLLYRHGASIEVLWLSLLTNVIITGLGTLVRFLLGRWKRIRLIHDA